MNLINEFQANSSRETSKATCGSIFGPQILKVSRKRVHHISNFESTSLRSTMPGTTSSINTKLKQHLSFRTAFNNQLFEETLSLKFSPQQKELKFSPQYKENRLWSRPPDLSVHYAFESFRKDFWVTDEFVHYLESLLMTRIKAPFSSLSRWFSFLYWSNSWGTETDK